MKKQVIIYFRNGRNDQYPIDVLNLVIGDRDVVDVIDAETGVVIYSAADGYTDPEYNVYFNAPMVNPLDLFRAAVNV